MSKRKGCPTLRPFWWDDDALWYVDQRRLPGDVVHARATDVGTVIDAISSSAITGSRSLAIFAAFGVVFARRASLDTDAAIERLNAIADTCALSTDALERVRVAPPGTELAEVLAVMAENESVDRSIAAHAQALLPASCAVLTHGGTGALCTGGFGTAAGAIVAAHQSGNAVHAYVGETRPLLTGRRLTAYELAAAGVGCTVISDGAIAALMRTTPIAAVVVSAIALAANGDAIGEIGTYGMAVVAAHHRVPFYVALPRASIDRSIPRGDAFPITAARIAIPMPISPAGGISSDITELQMHFDLTPGHLISAIITEYGVTRQPYYESLPVLASRPRFAFVHR